MPAQKSSPKKATFTLQKYQYFGWESNTAKAGDYIYVDLAHKHPDPLKALIWGYRRNGQVAPGDYVRFFAKIGKPMTLTFNQTGRYAAEEHRVRHDAILKAIKRMEK